MKTYFFSFLLSIFILNNKSTFLFKNKKYFKYNSVVFTQGYIPPFKIVGDQFTPVALNIEKAEELLVINYNEAYRRIGLKFNVKNPRKKLYKYRRQYLGYVQPNGDTIIQINLLNFTHKKESELMFENWHSEYIIGLGEFYEKNQSTFAANLATNSLSKI